MTLEGVGEPQGKFGKLCHVLKGGYKRAVQRDRQKSIQRWSKKRGKIKNFSRARENRRIEKKDFKGRTWLPPIMEDETSPPGGSAFGKKDFGGGEV